MILETTYDLYRAFLDGIKKAGNYSVNIPLFNRLINDWGQDEFIIKNVKKPEIDQTMLDKLGSLKVVTDNEFYFSRNINGSSSYVLKQIPCNINWTSTPKPNPENDIYFKFPFNKETTIDNVIYPEYMRLLNIEFKLEYELTAECDKTGISDWIEAHLLRADNESEIKRNPFRKPKGDSRVYYEFIGDSIKLTIDDTVKGYAMKLKYLRYPRKIFLNPDSTNAIDEQTGIPNYTGSVNGSVNCELTGSLRKEILDYTVKTFLERVEDVRYKSYLQELQIRNNLL